MITPFLPRRGDRFVWLSWLVLAVLAGPGLAQDSDVRSTEQVAKISSQILQESDGAKRESLIDQNKSLAAELIVEWTKDLAIGSDSSIEYQCIPSIWRVAILAVRDPATQKEVVPKLLELSLPSDRDTMRDWQWVVLGGAIINGLSLEGVWPGAALEASIAENPKWKPRWDWALELAKRDASDPKIPAGTRYDAIRVLAMLPAEQAVARIVPFLEDSNPDQAIRQELQMGAVSALGDIQDASVLAPLLSAVPKLTGGNRELARLAMQRTAQRRLAWDIYQSDLQGDLYRALPLTLDHAFTEGIEGPVSDAEGNVYAVNFEKNQTIGKVDRWGSGFLWAELPGRGTGNGIVLDSQGDLLVADYVEHKIWRIDRMTKEQSLVCHEPRMNQPNDLTIADDGTLYASDPDWSKGTGRIWRIDRKGQASVVAEGMGTTNGLDISPDGRYLSVNESLQRKIWRFEILKDGTLGQKALFKEFPDHGFDGMRYDQQGNLYVTRYGKGTVVVLSPQGEILREIDVLGARPSNLCFGGSDGKTVSVTEVERGRLVRFRAEHPGRTPRFGKEVERADWIAKVERWAVSAPAQSEERPIVTPHATLGDWKKARSETISRFERLLGPMPAVGTTPEFQTVSDERVDGVMRKRVRIEVEPQVWLDAYVLIPEEISPNEKRPGVVALHPTNSMTIDEIAGVKAQGPRATGWELVKRGYVVICPQCYLWQDVERFDQAVAAHRTRHPEARGIAKMVYDAQRALDLLVSLPEVDSSRLFAIGHSLGAKEVLYLMARDQRIVAGVASEGGVDLRSTNWEAPWYLGPEPRLNGPDGRYRDWGHEELLSLIAPRPVLIMGGQSGPGAADGTQSLGVMRRALPVWQLYRSEKKTGGSNTPEFSLGLGLWNHGQGHVFGEAQLERACQWLELAGSR